jgi:putative selenate reductase FAD-binding subunit
MITNYHRPQTLEEALKLLMLPDTRPLGGGTVLTQRSGDSFSVVDLQALGLDKLGVFGNSLEIGATVTLQTLLESPNSFKALKKALEFEAPPNLRNMGTVAGSLVTCDGRSSFGTVMLALDAKFYLISDKETTIRLGDLFPLRGKLLGGKLITKIEIPLNVKLSLETVARTPADKPIVCAALAQWPSGRTRLIIGGWGPIPTLAMDGNDPSGLVEAARNASSEAADEWASAEYRMEIAGILARRCQEEIDSSIRDIHA